MNKYSEQQKLDAVESYRSGELGLRATAALRNVDLKEAAKPLQLDGAQARLLQAAGASNLADIATVLRKRLGAAP